MKAVGWSKRHAAHQSRMVEFVLEPIPTELLGSSNAKSIQNLQYKRWLFQSIKTADILKTKRKEF